MHKYGHAIPKCMDSGFDVIIIGGGVVGCSIAKELSKYKLKVALFEKEGDVCGGASKANSGVVHSGIYSKPGSLKAELCVRGNELFPSFCESLGVEFNRLGKLVVARDDEEVKALEELKEVGDKNKVPGLEFVGKEKLKELEPNVRGESALRVPSAGIILPYQITIAMAENALENGVHIFLNSEVLDIQDREDFFEVETGRGGFKARFVVNCAGLYCDKIAQMVGIEKYKVYPCRGEYLILDKDLGHLINHLIYPVPENGSGGLGIHLTPTLEGNILIGPSAEYIDYKEDTSTTRTGINWLLEGARSFIENIPANAIIQGYAGIRCKLIGKGTKEPGDFVIEEDENVKGFINLMGIESPGLTASPAIAEMVVDIIRRSEKLILKKEFKRRKVNPRFHNLNLEAKANLIEQNPNHGHLICRCEKVTEQEIIDALENPLDVRTLAGIKYRSRATMGRCQGGFCKPKIIRIMEELYHPEIYEITLRGEGSNLFIGKTKDLRRHDR
jgi:glycerol-3-phosphate dehydrogenase